jgi:hypothetical protein
MTTSLSVNFNQTRNELIYAAMRKIGVIQVGEDPTAQETANAAQDLNRMIKAWNAQGLHLWKQVEFKVFLTGGTYKYSIGSTGDHAVNVANLVTTALTSDVASGAGTVVLNSVTGVATTYNIGILKDNNEIFWTTVNGAPSGTTVTLTATINGAATAGNAVYVYQNKITRPARIKHARRIKTDNNEIEVKIRSHDDYFRIPNKSSQGTVTQIYYKPTTGNGTLYVWQAPDNGLETLELTGEISIEDFDSLADDADFPQEWYEAIVYNLAVRIAPEYGVKGQELQDLAAVAAGSLDVAKGFDKEDVDIQFTPFNEGF